MTTKKVNRFYCSIYFCVIFKAFIVVYLAKRVATHVTYFSDASDVSDDSIHEVSVNDQINDG